MMTDCAVIIENDDKSLPSGGLPSSDGDPARSDIYGLFSVCANCNYTQGLAPSRSGELTLGLGQELHDA